MGSTDELKGKIDTFPSALTLSDSPPSDTLILEADGRIVSVSEDLLRTLGRPIESLTEALSDSEAFSCPQIVEAIERARRVWASTMQLVTQERAQRHYFLVRTEILRDRRGCERMAAMVLDLTEILHLADVEGDIHRQIRHDLRSPLTSLRGAVDLLRSGRVGALEEKQTKLLNLMDRAAQQMSDLLTASHPEPSPEKARVP